jgi:hypothetical protein
MDIVVPTTRSNPREAPSLEGGGARIAASALHHGPGEPSFVNIGVHTRHGKRAMTEHPRAGGIAR